MKNKFYKNTLILLSFFGFAALSSPASAHEFFWETWENDYSEHLYNENRSIQHHHPFQWKGAYEGEHNNVVNINKLLQNGQDTRIIHQVTFIDRAGYVDVSDLFTKLSYRDQVVFAHAIDGLLKARKRADYDIFYIRGTGDKLIGSYSKHGLDIY